MPIKVVCACGAAFAAKDELAGRTVKCPKCQQPLAIRAAAAPAAPAAKAPAAKAPPQKPAAPPRPAPSSGASSINLGSEVQRGASDVFSDVGLNKQVAGTRPCPGCMAPMPQNAVICIKCGYNAKLGRRMETVRASAAETAGGGGHGGGAQDLLNRAAQVIAEDEAEERKKTGEGLPWWAYLLGLIGVVGFIVMMMFIPQGTAMVVVGGILWLLAAIVAMYAGIRMIIIAFNESVACGIMYIVVPFYGLYYIFTRWDQCGSFFLMSIAANIVAALGQGAMMFGAVLRDDPNEKAYLSPHSRPVVVRLIHPRETTLELPIAREPLVSITA
jgi:hypothetical protein